MIEKMVPITATAGRIKEIKNYSIAGFILGVGFMTFAAIMLAVFPSQIISIFTSDKEVLKIA